MSNRPSSTTSRRAVLASLGAALPAVALAAPVAAATAHPDAALLALEPHILALATEVDALHVARSTIETACFAVVGPAPERPVFTSSDGSYEMALVRYHAAVEARGPRLADASERLGLPAAEEAHEDADSRLLAACRELAAMRATTLDGLILKARLSEHDGGKGGDLAPSILDDLRAMGGRA